MKKLLPNITAALKVTLTTLSLFAAIPAAHAQEENDVFIEFAEEPIEQGLTFLRDNVGHRKVNITGDEEEAWISGHRSVPEDEWKRSFFLRVTEADLQGEQSPMVRVEIVYCHEANTKVEVLASTREGGATVAEGWGNQRSWQTLTFEIMNPNFGVTSLEDEIGQQLESYDIRINAWGGDFYLRSVKITPL